MAERYVRAIEKVLGQGRCYLKLDGVLYKVRKIEIKGLEARFDCRSMQDGEEYEIKFKVNRRLLKDLLGFSLKDQKDSIFVISEDEAGTFWFETSMTELLKGIEEKEVRENLRKELSKYMDLEEEA